MKISHTQVKNQTRMVRGCEKGKYTRGTRVRVERELTKTALNLILEGRATRAHLQAQVDAAMNTPEVKKALRAAIKAQA